MLMSLGMFVFELPTIVYQELQRRTSWRHAQAGRFGARDANQFVGPGDDSISLNGTVARELNDGPASLQTLRDMGDEGEAWPLVDAAGNVIGSFVITGLDERHSFFDADGSARKIDFGLDLLHVDDAEATQSTQQPE